VDRSQATLDLEAPALVAPGQAAVFYDGDEVIGGGVVARPAV
jgi:tRNA-specific 2-thiouridylase